MDYEFFYILYIKYFVWEDQREKECYIFHKAAKWKIKHYVEYIELRGIYSTVMKTIFVVVVGVKFQKLKAVAN